MKKFRRKFNLNLIKKSCSYNIQEIAELLHVHPTSVRLWTKKGLKVIDDIKPFLIHCEDLRIFLAERQSKRKCKCEFEEFYCLKCRVARSPKIGTVCAIVRNVKIVNLSANCIVCGCVLNKTIPVKKVPEAIKTFNIITLQNEHILEPLSTSLITHLEDN